MKKILLLAALVAFCTRINAQTVNTHPFTSGHLTVALTDSMNHDSTNCTVWYLRSSSTTIDSSYIGETLYFIDSFAGTLITSVVNTTGASPWVVNMPIGAVFPAMGWPDADVVAGYEHITQPVVKTVCGTDTVFVISSDSLAVTNPCSWSNLSGRVYADNNGNCAYDAGDTAFADIQVNAALTFSPGTSNWSQGSGYSSYTDGSYSMTVEQSWMTSYTVSLPSYYAFIFPTSSCFTGFLYSFTTLPQTGVDFPLQCTSNVDVQCYPLSPGRVRLHRAFTMQPYVSNTGCTAVSGQLTLVLDSHVTYDAALSAHPADVVHGDTLVWHYYNLSNIASSGPYWNSFIGDIYLTPDPTLVVGDTLCFRTYTNIPTADINPVNNDYSVCLPVVYSYDPNEKEVSPKGTGSQGYIPAGPDTLTYTLHFQNTGSDVAENIKVIDTLDSHINPTTLRILGTSHYMTPKWLTAHVVEFDYDYINLPDSSVNEPSSHGEVRFSAALNEGLPYGTQIKNTGYIYFDLNPPVVTNTTLNTIATPSYIRPLNTTTNVKVYPNPATDQVTIENLNGGKISITNMDGITVMTKDIGNGNTNVDVSKLPAGVYLLKAVSNTNNATIKFTKY